MVYDAERTELIIYVFYMVKNLLLKSIAANINNRLVSFVDIATGDLCYDMISQQL